eukprot:m51a1_g3149 putative glutamate receptor (673) ;mRNA; f:322585-324737
MPRASKPDVALGLAAVALAAALLGPRGAAAGAASCVPASVSNTTPRTPLTVPVGLVMTVSDAITQQWWLALCLAQQRVAADLAAQGGGYSVKFLFVDDHSDESYACEAARAMTGYGVAAVIGSPYSGVSQRMQLCGLGASGVAQVSFSATSDALSNKTLYPTFARTCPADLVQAGVMYDLLRHYGVRSIVLIAEDNLYGTGGAAQLQRWITHTEDPAGPISVTGPKFYASGTNVNDLGLQLFTSRYEAKAFVVFCLPTTCYKVLSAAAASGLLTWPRVWILSDGAMSSSPQSVSSEEGGRYLEDTLGHSTTVLVVSAGPGPDSENSAQQELTKSLASAIKSSGYGSINDYAYYAYDAVLAVGTAIRLVIASGGNALDPVAVRAKLMSPSASVKGVTGYLSFGTSGDRAAFYFKISEWQSDQSSPTTVGLWHSSVVEMKDIHFGGRSTTDNTVLIAGVLGGGLGGLLVIAVVATIVVLAVMYRRASKAVKTEKQKREVAERSNSDSPNTLGSPQQVQKTTTVIVVDQYGNQLAQRTVSETMSSGGRSVPGKSKELMSILASTGNAAAPGGGIESTEPEAFVRSGGIDLGPLDGSTTGLPSVLGGTALAAPGSMLASQTLMGTSPNGPLGYGMIPTPSMNLGMTVLPPLEMPPTTMPLTVQVPVPPNNNSPSKK